MSNVILDVQKLEVTFKTPAGVVHAVNGISFDLREGETLGIVGKSGFGKSVTMMSLLKLIPSPPGKVRDGKALYFGEDLITMSNVQIRHVRGSQISMIFEDPMTSLYPVLTVGLQLEEPLILHLGMTLNRARERAAELLSMVGIPNAKDRLNDYPHQFSGGMRQRAMIAMALSCSPQVVIADEPTTALDVTIQAQIMDLVRHLRDELGMAIIWITHDLGVVAGLGQRVLVMYGGFIIEEAPVKELFANPLHPYTLGLLGSLPRVDAKSHHRLVSIDGLPPVLYEKPNHYPFAPRCKYAIERCWQDNPPLMTLGPQHKAACWVDAKTGKAYQHG